MSYPTIIFKTKPIDGTIKVPANLAAHVNRGALRTHKTWGTVANSAVLVGALERALRNDRVMLPDTRSLDQSHPAVTVSEGFMSTVTIDLSDLSWRPRTIA